ncbi:uncharacterized protein [Spinacia oleracea]|uniref:CCHC-type domain-containing protein n=1 Tax=Spinacia oleracea TaxID=3562 RepID=A0A9R0J0T6_SPIOL|nr:uncharacterized protein LOC110797161 [Spinacia oleracea]
MSNLAKLEIVALDITGKNYLSWVLDAEIHLDAKGIGETIKEGNKATCQDKAKAMIFLRHHLHEGLKTEYMTVKDPQILWSNLKERLQDFKSVSEYNSAMFKITSHLKLCGEKITDADMLEKTYSTFHANNVVLQTQYREKGFKKYSELISCLLVAEQNNELLMKNHEARPTGSTPFPEANVTSHDGKVSKNKDHASSSARGQWRGRGRGRGFGGYGRGRGGYYKSSHSHQKWDRKDGKGEKEKSDNVTSVCYRCGGKGHWSRVCRTPKHLVDLYQSSLKKKGKNVETNLLFEDGEGDFESGDTTHLEVADFFTSPEGNN